MDFFTELTGVHHGFAPCDAALSCSRYHNDAFEIAYVDNAPFETSSLSSVLAPLVLDLCTVSFALKALMFWPKPKACVAGVTV